MYQKILIANRGEIACRIIQTAQRLGIRCVAVYSEADKQARHVSLADEAYLLGAAPAVDSYLCGDKILAVAKASGAEAVHPGYGFLSENALFAKACADNQIDFIGPPISAIEKMGSKSQAKTIMEKANVPLVPGYHGDDQDPDTLYQQAEKCGFPLLLKAVAGGGGKGMRVVEQLDEFLEALAAAKREAISAFGNGDMLLERYLTQPRHVEIQVFCDQHGHGIYLSERDCSVQRRHQKIIEEAPAPMLSDEMRKAMGNAAVEAAKAINYQGAGTVEFLYNDNAFYFMEMNTRLQVEHPVTEMVTGLDLVEWQLLVATGAKLPLSQQQVTVSGHAFEARIYCEDPDNDFLPATGILDCLQFPKATAQVRIDTGVSQGDEVSVYYDPMIAKLIVWGEDRSQALSRMQQALASCRVSGVKHNVEFLHRLCKAQPFIDADIDTGFIEKHRRLLFAQNSGLEADLLLATAAAMLAENESKASATRSTSSYYQHRNWRMNIQHSHDMTLLFQQAEHVVKVVTGGMSNYKIAVNQRIFDIALAVDTENSTANDYSVTASESDSVAADGANESGDISLTSQPLARQFKIACYYRNHQIDMFYQGETHHVELYIPSYQQDGKANDGGLQAPMNGALVSLLVEPEQQVELGQTLAIMEAMKMELSIKAPYAGTVSNIYYTVGDIINEGKTIIDITPQDSE